MSQKVLNINVGILGHVDSGKTSLARAISTHFSTAALDRSVQSRERGITLDLGFSSFVSDLPSHIGKDCGFSGVQITLVDCPGHASLIRTIIGGAQIIDMMILVIDVTKGIQTQTAECLVIGEVLTDHLIVVLNKIDLFSEEKRKVKVDKIMKKLREKVFKSTKFGNNVTMVCASANPGGAPPGETVNDEFHTVKKHKSDIDEVVKTILSTIKIPDRNPNGDFLYAVDHCFSIKGKGTVLTGTVLNGSVAVSQTIEIPTLRIERKVKSLQMFHTPVKSASQGDRVGMLVTQLDDSLMERGLLCSPGSIKTFKSAIAQVEKIRIYKGKCESRSKFHISTGYTTVLATLQFFCKPTQREINSHSVDINSSNFEEKENKEINIEKTANDFDFSNEYLFLNELEKKRSKGTQFVLLEFERPITCPHDSLIIGSKLDKEITTSDIRLAFHGRLLCTIDTKDQKLLEKLHIYKPKSRDGFVDRIQDSHTIIGKDLFQKETDLSLFIGMNIQLDSGEVGIIEGSFGKSGKFKVRFPNGLQDLLLRNSNDSSSCQSELSDNKSSSNFEQTRKKSKKRTVKCKLHMRFKKYIFAVDKKLMIQ